MSGFTWRGESIDDVEILREVPPALVRVLSEVNGFILHNGALHVRGASLEPEWHSLRAALHGPSAFHVLYEEVRATDVPFAQDLLGDQFLLREGQVFRLSAATGDAEPMSHRLEDFFQRVDDDAEGFLNVGLENILEPGQLLMAYPPFVMKESEAGVSLKAIAADEVIQFHANLARQIRDIPDGGKIDFKIGN